MSENNDNFIIDCLLFEWILVFRFFLSSMIKKEHRGSRFILKNNTF
jgi:hypothetical protein